MAGVMGETVQESEELWKERYFKQLAKNHTLERRMLILDRELQRLNKACARNKRLAKRRYDALHNLKARLRWSLENFR